jgi:flagellar biosynthesis chaperone FliJ
MTVSITIQPRHVRNPEDFRPDSQIGRARDQLAAVTAQHAAIVDELAALEAERHTHREFVAHVDKNTDTQHMMTARARLDILDTIISQQQHDLERVGTELQKAQQAYDFSYGDYRSTVETYRRLSDLGSLDVKRRSVANWLEVIERQREIIDRYEQQLDRRP